MPAEVVVVKRSRRRAFAVLRATPAWLRSIWIAAWRNRRLPTSRMPSEQRPVEAFARAHRALRSARQPRLVRGASGHGDHRCVGCDLCVQICPSGCLAVATDAGADASGLRVLRFELEALRCIGCDRCSEACPENALEMVTSPIAAVAPRSIRESTQDLLEIAATGGR